MIDPKHALTTLLLLCLLILASPVLAQTETPEPVPEETPEVIEPSTEMPPPPGTPTPTPTETPVVPDFVYAWSVEPIYPSAVRFTLTLDRPLVSVTSLTLNLRPDGEPPRTRTVDAADSAVNVTQTYTDFIYIWQLDEPLPFPEVVTYDWFIVVDNNLTAEVPGAFLYGDTVVDWVRDDDPEGFLDLIYPQGRLNPSRVRDDLRPVYDLIAADLGANPRFSLWLHNNDFPMDPCISDAEGERQAVSPLSFTRVPCTPDVMAIADGIGYTPLRSSSITRGSALNQHLLDVMIDEFYGSVWAERDVPEWFQVGYSYFLQPSGKSNLIETARSAARTGQIYSLNRMNSRENVVDLYWEAQAYGFVLYMAEQIGVPALMRFAAEAGDGESFAQAYEAAVGRSLSALQPAWENWVFTGRALTSANVDLYRGPTQPPTETLSPTPFPPTATPTVTDTPTATPTPTVTGVLTATPLPTRTPSITPTAAPPSITPRPAGFRDPITPTLVPVSTMSADDQVDPLVAGGVAAIFITLAVLIVAAVRMTRNRN